VLGQKRWWSWKFESAKEPKSWFREKKSLSSEYYVRKRRGKENRTVWILLLV